MTLWRTAALCLLLALVGACGGSGAVPAVGSFRRASETGLAPVLPVAVRRLTNREFRKLASSLLQTEVPEEFEARLPADVRQEDGYTRNVDQTMSAALALGLEREVPELVHRALSAEPSLFPCPSAELSCVRRWIIQKRRLAFRRPVEPAEVATSLALYRQAAQVGGAQAGAEVVLTEMLLSPRAWYATELGVEERESGELVQLSQYEIADQISLVVRGTVADDVLLAAAAAGQLSLPRERQQQARRLLAANDTREHYREFVTAWLEVDSLLDSSKSDEVFERYDAFKPLMLAETERFTDEVFVSGGASVRSLLDGRFASVDPPMAVFYGLKAYGPKTESVGVGRVGVLQHASFLANHSHSDTTSPVLRGDFVLRKVLCHRLPRPSELDIEVFMPRPSHEITRREQFQRHAADPRCSECHDQIDGFGLVFEEFDAAGKRRTQELGAPVRTDGSVVYAGDRYSFSDSTQLSSWLATRDETAECFARQLFRFVTGRVQPAAERAFVDLRRQLPEDQRDNVLEHLVALVGSETFIWRRKQRP